MYLPLIKLIIYVNIFVEFMLLDCLLNIHGLLTEYSSPPFIEIWFLSEIGTGITERYLLVDTTPSRVRTVSTHLSSKMWRKVAILPSNVWQRTAWDQPQPRLGWKF